MKFYLSIQGETVIIQASIEGEDGTIGDYSQVIHPGEAFNGIPYEQIRKLAEQEGGIEIAFPSEGDITH